VHNWPSLDEASASRTCISGHIVAETLLEMLKLPGSEHFSDAIQWMLRAAAEEGARNGSRGVLVVGNAQ
jgi:hypothetical protein